MTCAKCGAALVPGSRFCQQCGVSFEQPVPYPAAPPSAFPGAVPGYAQPSPIYAQQVKTPTLQKPWVIVLWMLFFFPVGLYAVWIHPRWTTKSKWIITGAFATFIAIGGIYDNSPAGKADKARQEAEDAQAAQQIKADAAAKAAADQAKQDQDARDAKQDMQIASKALKAMQDEYLVPPNTELISNVEICADPYDVKITVTNEWFTRLKQIRLQSAQNLWKEWAALRSPDDPDKATITLVDVNGNNIGGSSSFGGSLVKVDN